MNNNQKNCLRELMIKSRGAMAASLNAIINSLRQEKLITDTQLEKIQGQENEERENSPNESITKIFEMLLRSRKKWTFEKFYSILRNNEINVIADEMEKHIHPDYSTTNAATFQPHIITTTSQAQTDANKQDCTSKPQAVLPEEWPPTSKEPSPFFVEWIPSDIRKFYIREQILDTKNENFPFSRGSVVIINNIDFTKSNNKHLTYRDFTNWDAGRIKLTFGKRGIGFDTPWEHDNRTAEEIKTEVRKAAQKDESKNSFICFIFSHGAKGGSVYGVDGELVNIDTLVSIARESLPDTTPVIFFIQACRGENRDMKGDEPITTESNLPKNVIVAQSTKEGYLSHKNAMGSWFIMALVYVIRKFSYCDHLQELLEMVITLVSMQEGSECHDKQRPFIEGQLEKNFYFFPGVTQKQANDIKQSGS